MAGKLCNCVWPVITKGRRCKWGWREVLIFFPFSGFHNHHRINLKTSILLYIGLPHRLLSYPELLRSCVYEPAALTYHRCISLANVLATPADSRSSLEKFSAPTAFYSSYVSFDITMLLPISLYMPSRLWTGKGAASILRANTLHIRHAGDLGGPKCHACWLRKWLRTSLWILLFIRWNNTLNVSTILIS